MYPQLALLQQFRPRAAVGCYIFFAAAITLLPASGFAGGIELDSREYKLMLRPTEFFAADPQQAVKRFITEQLVPAVRDQWNADAANELAKLAKKGLEVGERRIVRFWDSGDCLLFRHGFAWRQRVDIDEHGARADDVELTLKFRSPDAFLAASTPLKATGDGVLVEFSSVVDAVRCAVDIHGTERMPPGMVRQSLQGAALILGGLPDPSVPL